MRSNLQSILAAMAVLVLLAAAAPASEPAPPTTGLPARAIYIPFSDLHVLLQREPKRVLIGRQEYDELVKKAQRAPEAGAPCSAVLTAADYAIMAGRQRAEIVGRLTVEVMEDGLHALPLELAGVGLLSARLDDRPAPLGQSPRGQPVLFVEGVGRHRLKLEMTAPLEMTAARQVLNFRLPRPAAATMRLEAPGDVEIMEIKRGAEVISRKVDAVAGLTRFELLLRRGDTSIVMTLNSRLLRRQRAVIARSVTIDEVSEACEKLLATVTLEVLHRPVDRFRFVVPDGFEVTEVVSPLLARWEVVSEDGRRVLEARLREQTTETVTFGITAIRAPAKLQRWSAPRLVPLDVIGGVTVLGLLVEDRLKVESLSGEGLIPIDTSVLGAVSPSLRAAAAWYAPRSDYALTARFVRPPAEMDAITNLLLVFSDKGHDVHGGVSLLPRVEKRFSFDLAVPAGWQVTSVTAADGKPLPFEYYPAAKGESKQVSPLRLGEGTEAAGRVHVAIDGGIEAGKVFRANFRAVRTPSGWLADWRRATVEFPHFAVIGATQSEGAIAVNALDEMTVRPEKLARLTPLSAAEKHKYGLADVPTMLAYRCRRSEDYVASLVVERTEPRMTARTFSFLRVDRDALHCHYEVAYTIEQSRSRRLILSLPKNTPKAISITGLDGVKVKEYTPKLAGDRRFWTVLLAEPSRRRVRLAVDFQQRLPSSEPKGFSLPIVEAGEVAYQSGLVAVEGCAELDVRVDTSARQVDVGELAEADYQPGRRLLGAYGFIGDPPAVKIDVLRHPGYGIQSVIVQRCQLDTVLSPDGRSQTQARFELRSKALFVQVDLPQGAELWSAELDGVPLKPQRDGRGVLIDLSAGKGDSPKTLQITYAAPVRPVGLRGTVQVPAPKLLLHGTEKGGTEVIEAPLADLVWKLHLPNGYEVVRADGTLTTDDISRPMPAAVQVAGALYRLSGGLCGPPLLLPAGCSVREAARRTGRSGSATLHKPIAKSPASKKDKHQPLAAPSQAPAETRIKAAVIPFDDKLSTVYPDAKTGKDLTVRRKGKYAAAVGLSGVRSLKIDLIQAPKDSGRVITFRSLGVDPLLEVTLVNRARLAALGWALALTVGLVGAALTRRPVRTKTAYILAVMMLTTLVPLAGGGVKIAQLCNMMFFAAALLVSYYLAAGFLQWSCRLCCRICIWCVAKLTGKTVVSAALLLAVLIGATAHAKPQAAEQRVVKMPEDALIIPYDPDWKNGIKDADKLLVPYEKYVELWNRAYPDKKIETKAPPAQYALADAAYKTLLEGEDFLLLTGRMEIDIFADGHIQVPLGLGGGVITRAELDGKPARLSVLTKPQADAATPLATSQSAAQNPLAVSQRPANSSVVVLHASGKGRHKLELAVRIKLRRQGGWRVAEGVLPSAPATVLEIVIPKAHTELRLGRLSDRRHYETEKPDQTIRTALGDNGTIALRWRPRVDAGRADRTLTVASCACFDVQEDGLRLSWRLALEFRAERNQFNVTLPEEYLLEKVEGDNVRGWEVRRSNGKQIVEVTLLQAAKDHEQFTLRLRLGGKVGHDELARFDVPVVVVEEAALHCGRLTVRRSPLLELRTLDRSGVTRIDLPSQEKLSFGDVRGTESPLGIRPFKTYSFAAVPFTVRLAAAPLKARVSANVETVLKLAEYEQRLESRVRFDVRGRPVYRLRLRLPEGFRLDRVEAPGEFQYTVTKEDGRPLLTVYLASGRQGEVPVVVSGNLGRQLAVSQRELPLPRLEALDVERQQGDMAVQADPAFDVEALDLIGCESVLLGRLFGWLNPEQREVARLALHYSGDNYAGKLRLKPRSPDVVCDTITNVRVTDRALEETILLDFNVARAGVRRLEFLLPDWMADSRIGAPMLQRKTVAPAGEKYPGLVRVRIELQDDVMGQLRVLVENDRLLTRGSHLAPIPVVETGRTNRRYVVVENVGRDEVVVEQDKLREMEVLGSRRKEWDALKAILGGEMTMAYLVSPDAERPRLSFHAESHAAVETVKASIGLSETTLVVDANGAYRAEVTLHVNNATEQYLEIQLPEEATLWTVQVAGEPVKPTQVAGGDSSVPSDPRKVRIPIIKTAPGDLSYKVVLRYGGKMPALRTLGAADFPMIRCVNITPELSQAKLYLPERYRWFDFGGTMRLLADEAGLQLGFLQYQTNQLRQIATALQSGDKWTKVRAASNLKQIGLALQNYAQSPRSKYNPKLQAALSANADAMRQTQQEAARQEKAPVQTKIEDNRQRLSNVFQTQKTNLAKNVVGELGANFVLPSEELSRKIVGGEDSKPATRSKKMKAAPQIILQEKNLRSRRDGRDVGQRPQKAYEAESLDRYKQRLAAQTTVPTDAPRSGELLDHDRSAPGGQPASKPSYEPTESPFPTSARGPVALPPAAGLASLDFELPIRGTVYRFTTPRGEQKITARYLSGDICQRLVELALLGVAILVVWFVARLIRGGGLDWLAHPSGSWLLICLGLLSFFGGVLPVAGLALIVAGCGLKIQHRRVVESRGGTVV